MSSAEAIARAIRGGDPEAIAGTHAQVLAGTPADLAAAERAYLDLGRADLAGDVAFATGRLREAAELAERAGDLVVAGRRWCQAQAWARAEAALSRSGDAGARDHATLLLRLDRPREALARLAPDDGPLLALCLLRLGLVEGAIEVMPDLGDPLIARARLEAELGTAPLSGHLGPVRVHDMERDGLGYLGELDGQRVAVRALGEAAWDATMDVYDAGIAGVPPLVEAAAEPRRVTLRALGEPLDRWVGTAERARRVFARVLDVLAAAHAQGLVHGALRVDDVRVAAGDLVTVDGWHRLASLDSGVTRAPDPLDLIAPTAQLQAGAVEAADDGWSLAALARHLFDAPCDARDIADLRSWLAETEAPLRTHAAAPSPTATERYVARGEGWHDTWLDLAVERHPRPADLARVRSLARCRAGQLVLAVSETEVVLQALPDTPAGPLTEPERVRVEHDRALGFAVAESALRRTRFGVRWRVDALD